MDVLLAKPVVVGLAILGGLLAAAASYLQMRGYVSEKIAKAINYGRLRRDGREHAAFRARGAAAIRLGRHGNCGGSPA